MTVSAALTVFASIAALTVSAKNTAPSTACCVASMCATE
eukprot:CAMPEP_0115098266 /NCGR_PEP_ID=MMETSP0227-20121206/31041_1 /TAXON_ID=89957 /ORGANISM="Polarella glacialis, Strain CCMP 1383" /LENGTH=38 /DNA_ID= /DNA_START= /DNA_END= /DNA_ORIENTATION=